MNKNINIPGRLHSVATDGQVAGANEIYDDEQQKFQGEINAELHKEMEDAKEVVDSFDDRVKAIEDLAEISIEGGEVQVANTAEEIVAGSGKIPTANAVAQLKEDILLGAVWNVSAKNPTAGPNNDGKWESLSALLSDANLNTLIPTSVRRGGISVKFVQSSDNKYVQYRLMSDTFNTTPVNWQGVDEEPTTGSHNLVESGGVADKLVCLTFVNVNYLLGTANFFTFQTAIQSVPLDRRAYGCIVTWRESNFVWKTVQYLVMSTSDTDWFNSRNWKSIVVDTAFVVRGGIDKNGEPYNYADYMSSNYFKAENGIVITGSQGSKSAMVCFYDETFNFISYANVPTGEQSIILGTAGYEIPNGAVYFRASGSRVYNNGYISFTGFPACDATFVQDWKNSVRQNFSQFMTLDIGYSIGSLNVGDIVTPSTQYNISSVKVKCKQGDIFEISGRGGGGPRLYGWCDNEMKLISMSDSSLLYSGRITAPSDGYLIFNNLVNIITNPYIARVNIKKTETNKYFIKIDGSGDFPNLVTALKVLSGDETYKEIYVEGGTYNILQEMGGQSFINSIPSDVQSSDWPLYSNFVSNNTKITGLGNVTLNFQVPDDTPSAKMAVICPLAFRKNVIIENLTITAKNCRYCIHDETGNDSISYTKIFRNLKLYKTGGGYSASFGCGFSKNSNYIFDGCVFSSVASPVWSVHDNVAENDFTNIIIKNCVFIAASGVDTQQALYLGTVNATSGVKNVMIENCNLGTGKIYLADSASKPNSYQITVLKSGTPNFVVVSGDNPYTPNVYE